MKPTDDDSGIPDDPHDELVAQIVPLRRRQDDTGRGEQPHDESQAAAKDADDWSVFDPPEDLQLAERAQTVQHSEPDSDHDLSGEDLERPWTPTSRTHNRLVAFAGIAVTTLAIATVVVLTLKGHAGASPRQPLAPKTNVGLTSANHTLAVHEGESPAPRRGRPVTQPSHRRSTKRRASPRKLPHTATAGTPTGEGTSASRSPDESTPTGAQSEPSSSNASAAQSAGSEFGIER